MSTRSIMTYVLIVLFTANGYVHYTTDFYETKKACLQVRDTLRKTKFVKDDNGIVNCYAQIATKE